ncbi:uncharacterized protein LOC121838203 [Ixodes scapularis]|uniref:uncharacterized protein LOC121838203 n=1 Tax=Ixodes scapularis TaxID=6945 RepID=UPI001C38F6E1|nr:uncharacterized protein LOC121838203 [Ixodes scapularis]
MYDAHPFIASRDFIFAELSNMKAVTFLLSIYFSLARQVMTNNGTEIDDRPDCEKHQDINRALQNVDPFSWMYHRTYRPNPGEPEFACVYANVTKLNGTGNYVFRQGWTTADNKTVEVPLFVKTERTPEYQRQEDNAMRVTLRNATGAVLKDFALYKLIYSDYTKCDILRVTSRGQACELYVHSKYLDEAELKECIRYYKHACVKEGGEDYKVYNEHCKTHQKPKLAATALPQSSD